ncbi:MAG: glycosyltransferase family 39 protein [Victivallaceae bacterium]|nr:glycosyltransferase family 39 protein [Victivallaceae bacterium]
MCEKSGNLATRPAWDVWEKCVFGIVLLTGLALLGICVFFYDIPERDVALRYSPMADAFAAGNFRYAFHPRVPLLVPLLGGIVAKIVGCGGFMALKIVTALAFLGALFPLRGLMRRVFNDDKIAAVACGIYLLCPALMRLAYGGERDGIKSLIIVSIAYFLVRIQQKTDDFSAYAGFGFFCGIATLVRVELLLVSAVSLFWLFCLETRAARWPKRSFAALLIALLFPCIGGVVNYALFGVAAPDSYTEKIVTGILGRTNTFGEFCAVMPVGFSLFALTGAFFGRLRGKKILWAVLAVAVVVIAGCWLLGGCG